MGKIVYEYSGNLYVNLTNRCNMACTYCIKYKWANKFRGNDLKLDKEPTATEVIEAIGDINKYKEIIFCGYGESLIKIEELKEVAKYVKNKGGKVRINTAGNANLYHKRNIIPELKGLVDTISISINTHNPEEYIKINRPEFKEKAFQGALDFITECKKYIPEVTLTTVELPGTNVEECRKIAKKLGVNFRVREYLEEYEES